MPKFVLTMIPSTELILTNVKAFFALDHLLLVYILPLGLALEVIIVGFRKSSIFLAYSSPNNRRWDLLAIVMNVFFRSKDFIANIFYLGFYSFLAAKLGQIESLQLFSDLDLVWRVILAVVFSDFLAYWVHRAFQRSSLLWNAHQWHHSSTTITLFSDLRNHPLQRLFLKVCLWSPVHLVFGLDVTDAVLFSFLISMVNLLNHSRIDTSYSVIGKYLIVSPRYHHLHHEIQDRMGYNFAEIFVFWDRIFGTYRAPDQSIEKIVPGLEVNNFESSGIFIGFLQPVWNFYLDLYRGLKVVKPRWPAGIR
jgi:sterol desaturase/sphingolipid hydroxylase (fatty acid hydroxylase superfamily)